MVRARVTFLDPPASTPPRTPNGASDLLSGSERYNNDNDQEDDHSLSISMKDEHSIFIIDDDDDDEIISAPPPSSFRADLLSSSDNSNLVYTNSSDEDSSIGDMIPTGPRPEGASVSDIYQRLDSFERRMESELQGLEQLGVNANSSSFTNKMRRQQDPDGTSGGSGGASPSRRLKSSSASSISTASTRSMSCASSVSSGRTTSSTLTMPSSNSNSSKSGSNSSSSILEKGNGKSGKNLAMLSGKTDKIMSDYQAYLEEIQTERVHGFSRPITHSQEDDMIAPALANIHSVRENVKYTYNHEFGEQDDDNMYVDSSDGGNSLEEGRGPSTSIQSYSKQYHDEGYATGGGEPLYRAWSSGSSGGSSGSDDGLKIFEGVFEEEHTLMRPDARRRFRARRMKRIVVGVIALVGLIACILALATSGGNGSTKEDESNVDKATAGAQKTVDKNKDKDWDVEYESTLEKEAEVYGGNFYGGDGEKDTTNDGENEDAKDKEPAATASVQEAKEEEEQNLAAADQIKASPGVTKEVEGPTTFINEQGQVQKIDQWKLSFHAKQEQLHEMEKEESHHTTAVQVAGNSVPLPSGVVASSSGTQQQSFSSSSSSAVAYSSSSSSGSSGTKDIEEVALSTIDTYGTAFDRFRPLIFDRDSGWEGQTYIEALIFCEGVAGLAVCPYEAVCPDGMNGEPLGGFRDGLHGDWAWMPIVNDHNDWVQVGAREKCVKYSEKFGDKPEWGMTGEDSADLTENVRYSI